ncbi:GspH/FimT family pseudopilin [Variovorax beijingensis]|uniref:GspH/FimT family pseudopilin n=1 Tax=Variovorax beijingensis TaxID=2496117 RepID=UPI001F0C34DA|nr:GspH/FimT family pseudopilin [Variovorax beijingensis]
MLTQHRPCSRQRGFTLVEMVITFAIMALLAALAMPSMLGWVRNNKIRTVSDSLQNGLRLAQAEATRRSRQVVFALTDDKPAGASTAYTAKTDGSNWAIETVAALTEDGTGAFVEAGVLRDVGSNVMISGPAAICFNALGRLVANASPGVTGANCGLPSSSAHVYTITMSDQVTGDRPLKVTVALGGQIRLCDPSRTLSSSQPDGCPASP